MAAGKGLSRVAVASHRGAVLHRQGHKSESERLLRNVREESSNAIEKEKSIRKLHQDRGQARCVDNIVMMDGLG